QWAALGVRLSSYSAIETAGRRRARGADLRAPSDESPHRRRVGAEQRGFSCCKGIRTGLIDIADVLRRDHALDSPAGVRLAEVLARSTTLRPVCRPVVDLAFR